MATRKELVDIPAGRPISGGIGGGGNYRLARPASKGGGARARGPVEPNERAKIGGNQPPPEAKLPVERGAKPKATSGNFKLKAEPRSTPKGDRVKPPLAAPAVQTRGDAPAAQKIFDYAAENPAKYPMANEPLFAPADAALTKEMVPQTSIADRLPPMPSPDKLPGTGRVMPIMENADAIANEFVKDLSQPGVQNMPFYSTGTVLQGLQDRAGMRPEEASDFMRRWAGQGAATSPRTKTPQNLRNAAFLMYERAQGNPLTSSRQQQEQDAGLWGYAKGKGGVLKPNMNRPGFPMMAMHTNLADEVARGEMDAWSHPKPTTFGENWSGNMADVTGDTHYIRKTLDVMDRLDPGSLGRDWFMNDKKGAGERAFQEYKDRGGFNKEGELPVGAIEDGLGGRMIPGTGRYGQTEYPVMTQPAYMAAEKMGISPAEVQERLWFEGGPRTGLKSPSMTIPDLFNSQVEKTAKVLGITPEEVLRLFSKSKIPMAENAPQNVPGESGVG